MQTRAVTKTLFWGCSYCSNVRNMRCTLWPCVLGGMGAQRARQHAELHCTAPASRVAEVTTPRVLVVIDGLHIVFRISNLPHIGWVFNLLSSFSCSIVSQLLSRRCPSFSLFQNLKIWVFQGTVSRFRKNTAYKTISLLRAFSHTWSHACGEDVGIIIPTLGIKKLRLKEDQVTCPWITVSLSAGAGIPTQVGLVTLKLCS